MEKRLSLISVAREVGLDPLVCPHCKRRVKTGRLLVALFDLIVDHVSKGRRIYVEHFGSFRLVMRKSTRLNTPLFPDRKETGAFNYVSFAQAKTVRAKLKEKLND